MDYVKETRLAYIEKYRAKEYHRHLTREISWARFVTWREKKCVEKAFGSCEIDKDDIIIDLPCGTGILADEVIAAGGAVIAADISVAMMEIAGEHYSATQFKGFMNADITHIPLRQESIACAIVIGLMHRVPPEVRVAALNELSRITFRYIVVSFSVDTFLQKIKKRLLRWLFSEKILAPSPERFSEICAIVDASGMQVSGVFRPMPFFSSEIILLLKKRPITETIRQ